MDGDKSAFPMSGFAQSGMNLRTYMATHIAAGVRAAGMRDENGMWQSKDIAAQAVSDADALLERLSR